MISLLTGLRGVAASVIAALIWNTIPQAHPNSRSICRDYEPDGPISSMDDHDVMLLAVMVEMLFLVVILFPWSWSRVADVYRIDDGRFITRRHDILAFFLAFYSFLLIVTELSNQRSSFCNYTALYTKNKYAYYGYVVYLVIPIWIVKILFVSFVVLVSVGFFVAFHIKVSLWILGSLQVPEDDGAAPAA